MNHPIINLDEVEPQPLPPGYTPIGAAAERYAPRIAQLSRQLGARQLGYNLIELDPGKRAFPFHSHRANEELFLILTGSGEIRLGADTFPLRSGDLVACPAGGPETAHQIINTGSDKLRYLALSTKQSPDIAEYPDSGKYAVMADAADPAQAFRAVGRQSESPGYWDDE